MQSSSRINFLDKPKIRIVVLASGWNKTQEYDNALVKKFIEDGYVVDVVSYDNKSENIDQNMSIGIPYYYVVDGSEKKEIITRGLLDDDKATIKIARKVENLLDDEKNTIKQSIKDELENTKNNYTHTVYINGFGDDDQDIYDANKDIFTTTQDRTCLNWCTCCRAPEISSDKLSEKTPSSGMPFQKITDSCYIKYNTLNNQYENALTHAPYNGEVPIQYSNDVNEILANKKHNADFSPSLVESICGKIKQQEQQNVSQFNMSNDIFDYNKHQPNIAVVEQENQSQGWFHKTVGIPFRDYILCCATSHNVENNSELSLMR